MNSRFCVVFPHLIIVMAIVVGSVRGNKPLDADDRSDLRGKDLIGFWVGHDICAPDREWNITFLADRVEFMEPSDRESFEGEYKFVGGDNTGQIDIRIDTSSTPECFGKTALGIFELADGRLILAMNVPGKETRPDSFDPGDDVRVFEVSCDR